MTERAMPMSGPLVLAVQANRKTVTRRLIKPQPPSNGAVYDLAGTYYGFGRAAPEWEWHVVGPAWAVGKAMGIDRAPIWKPRYQPGDIAYVTEAWRARPEHDHLKPSEIVGGDHSIWYEASQLQDCGEWGRYRHARFMCRWMSRIDLRIIDVRPKRVQDITEGDARREGITSDEALVGQIANPYRTAFADLWDSIYGPGAWKRNDWVWRYEFEVIG
jgi:hypothetical protein